MKCNRCNSADWYISRRTSFEKLLAPFKIRPYRCACCSNRQHKGPVPFNLSLPLWMKGSPEEAARRVLKPEAADSASALHGSLIGRIFRRFIPSKRLNVPSTRVVSYAGKL